MSSTRVLMGVLLAALLLTLRPQAIGGAAAYLTVDEPGLEPALFPGDLAIVRMQEDYRVGDLIAVQTLEGPFFGRIIGGDDTAYRVVFQGTADAVAVPGEYIVGRLWFNLGVFGRRLSTGVLDAFGLEAEAAR
ncbi:MAG TPA: hypothetical protein VI520_03875 [Anaerolineales bacterium]|nr:hypothetical protein [Anaerolineales bacterium]